MSEAEDVQEALAAYAAYDDPLVAARMGVIEALRKENPVLAQFSPESLLREDGGMGSVFVSHWKRGMPFTNIQSKHVKPLFFNYIVGWVHKAAREMRMPDIGDLLAYFEWLMANKGGWLAEQYVRTGIAGIGPPPKKPGRLARFFGRR